MPSSWIPNRFALGLAVFLPLLGSAPASAEVATPPGTAVPIIAITALHAAGSDLAVDLMLSERAPAKLVLALETAAGIPVGTAVLSPAPPGRVTVRLAGAVERFLANGFDYRIRLREGRGIELAEPSPFTVGLSCSGEVCRFIPELGVEAGAAVWMEDRLAAALRSGNAAAPDLLSAAVDSDPSLLGAARNLAARFGGQADGACRCRWVYSTSPNSCGAAGITLGIYDKGIPEDELSARRLRRGVSTLESLCWTARGLGTEAIGIAFDDRVVQVAWPRVSLASCGSCAGLPVQRVTFLGGAHAFAEGSLAVSTRASWSFQVAADGSPVLSGSDVRSALSPAGEDRDESQHDWTGTARTIEWNAELEALLNAPAGVTFGFADAQVAYRIRTTAEAACAIPSHVEVGRIGSWQPLASPIDPNQISVVIGECRPPN